MDGKSKPVDLPLYKLGIGEPGHGVPLYIIDTKLTGDFQECIDRSSWDDSVLDVPNGPNIGTVLKGETKSHSNNVATVIYGFRSGVATGGSAMLYSFNESGDRIDPNIVNIPDFTKAVKKVRDHFAHHAGKGGNADHTVRAVLNCSSDIDLGRAIQDWEKAGGNKPECTWQAVSEFRALGHALQGAIEDGIAVVSAAGNENTQVNQSFENWMEPVQMLEHDLNVLDTQQVTINGEAYQQYRIYSVQHGDNKYIHAMNEHKGASIRLPACLSRAITVGATDKDAIAWQKSAIGSQINLYAPGVDLRTKALAIRKVTDPAKLLTGTSFAAPQVAGVVACIIQGAAINNSRLTVEEIMKFLLDACVNKNRTQKGDERGDFKFLKPETLKDLFKTKFPSPKS